MSGNNRLIHSYLISATLTPEAICSQPATMPTSNSINGTATAALLATMQQTTASNIDTAAAASTGFAIVNGDCCSPTISPNSVPQVVIGQYGMNPKQLETAGLIKPGSSTMVNSVIAGGTAILQQPCLQIFGLVKME